MDGGDDGDLMSIVRSFCLRGQSTPPPQEVDPFSLLPPPPPPLSPPLFSFSMEESFSEFSMERSFGGIEQICMPFLTPRPEPEPEPEPEPKLKAADFSSSAGGEPTQNRPPRRAKAKKRKKLEKKTVKIIPTSCVSTCDNWAWRKYGQKPIKGSPYPRGYYKCSSSKNCPARKQIEKSWTEPGMLIVTYNDEHNHPLPAHRNSLAGTTRTTKSPPASDASALPSGLSPTTPLKMADEEEDEDEAMLQVEDMEIAGEDELLFLGAAAATTSSAFFDKEGNAGSFDQLWSKAVLTGGGAS